MADEPTDRCDVRCLAARLLIAGLVLVSLAAFAWWTFIRPHQLDVARPPANPPPTPTGLPAAPWSPWDVAFTGEVGYLATIDLDADERADIVAFFANGDVVALSGENGTTLWTFEAKSPLTAPTIADLDGDGRDDILVGTKDGRALAFAGDGNVLWIHRFHEEVFQVGAADIDRDGAADAVVAYPRGVKVLSGRTAMQVALLEYPRPGKVRFSLGDLDGDGTTDWVANYDEAEFHTRGVSGKDASTLWMRQTGSEVLSVPAIGDFDGDGKADVLFFTGVPARALVVAGATGRELWDWQTLGGGPPTPEVTDLDGDGVPELLFCTSGWVTAVSARDGSQVWSFKVLTGKDVSPQVCDVEGDGALEVIVPLGMESLALLVARDGTVLARLDLESVLQARPAVGDLDGDGRLEVVAPTKQGVVALRVPRKER